MSSSFTVDPEELKAKGDSLSRTAGDLEGMWSTMNGQMNDLAAVWHGGQSSEAFQGLFQQWGKSYQQVQNLLDEVASSLKQAGFTFSDVDSAAARSFRSF